MLRNFITDTDLKKYHPNISKELWTGQADYSTQILQAFDILQNELHSRQIDPRLCMVPLDLKLPLTKPTNTVLTSTTETASTNGNAFQMSNARRLVVNVSAIHAGDSWAIKLQGSNTNTTPVAGDSTVWEDVPSIASQSTAVKLTITATGEASIKFNNQYRWYRYVSTPTGATPSLAYTVYLVDAMFDNVICYGSFNLIFADFARNSGDIWDDRLKRNQQAYESALQTMQFSYDSNDDGIPEPNEAQETSQVRLQR